MPWVNDSGSTRPWVCFWMRSSPTAAAALSASLISSSLDQRLAGVGAALHRVVDPRAGVAVGLQLEGDPHQPLRLAARLLHGGVLPGEVLHVVAELVGDDVLRGEVAGGAEVGLQLVQEVEVDVHEGVGRAVERPGLRRRRAAAGVRPAGEEHQLGVVVGLAERLRVGRLPVVLDVLVGAAHDLLGLGLAGLAVVDPCCLRRLPG